MARKSHQSYQNLNANKAVRFLNNMDDEKLNTPDYFSPQSPFLRFLETKRVLFFRMVSHTIVRIFWVRRKQKKPYWKDRCTDTWLTSILLMDCQTKYRYSP